MDITKIKGLDEKWQNQILNIMSDYDKDKDRLKAIDLLSELTGLGVLYSNDVFEKLVRELRLTKVESIMNLPNAQDILKVWPNSKELFGNDGSIRSNVIIQAMKEYARQVLDYAAEKAEMKVKGNGFLQQYKVDKQSILKIKDEL
jgi:hypothetical protein